MNGQKNQSNSEQIYDVLVIGTGFSGLGMGAALKKEGRHSFAILEKSDEVGGTWRDNRYPGCACDIPSHLYSFSFAPNPDWTRLFAPQQEIFDYLKNCADSFGLRPHIQFGTEVLEARYLESNQVWQVKTGNGKTLKSKVLVSGQGALHFPSVPDIAGLETFGGEVLHSASWKSGTDLKGKRVAVVGTGASAVQIVPTIAPEVSQLYVFQRSASWILPKPDRPISHQRRKRMAKWPFLQKMARLFIYGMLESRAPSLLKDRNRKKQEKLALDHLAKQVTNESLRIKLTPDYHIGCKRTLISNDFYPALNRANVELITDGIEHITSTGLQTATGHHEIDVLIFATGFAVTDPSKNPLDIIGREGRSLKKENAVSQKAYLGVAAEGFPNLYFLMGPHTGLGHNSMVYMIESQIQFVMSVLEEMEHRGAGSAEVRKTAQDSFEKEMDSKMQGTVWSSGCTSWYLDSEGRNTTIWPDYTFRYRQRTRRINSEDFEYKPVVKPACAEGEAA